MFFLDIHGTAEESVLGKVVLNLVATSIRSLVVGCIIGQSVNQSLPAGMHEICVRQVASFCPPNSLLQQCRLHLLSTSMLWLILFPFLLSSPLPVKKSHPGWMKNNFAVFFSSFSFSLFPLTNADCLFHSISQAVIRINWLKTSITLLYR